jgi:hypothetical protein
MEIAQKLDGNGIIIWEYHGNMGISWDFLMAFLMDFFMGFSIW